MIVSWRWLQDYVSLETSGHSVSETAERLMMAGLNHESTTSCDDDFAIDLEVTSNRADCLGHIGIAREASVLLGLPLSIPEPAIENSAVPLSSCLSVENRAEHLCPRYMARVIRGVKVGPSPAWLVQRLKTIGIPSINNVVDVTNYVLMESGLPLHAFDLAKLRGGKIVVREALPGERFTAINHKEYVLTAGMCVIADERSPVALGGVMGGAESEISASTTDVVIETAEFAPLGIRNTTRKLNLRSDSSYRFERPLDRTAMDWVNRRCCQLIVQVAGGAVLQGAVDLGKRPIIRDAITLRYARIERVLGIPVPTNEVNRILSALGCQVQHAAEAKGQTVADCSVVPPAWRKDLAREIDLIEEVARVYGYDKIPEDVRVPMARGAKTMGEKLLARVRHVLTASGFDEAMTISAVSPEWSEAFSPWTSEPPLVSSMPVLRGATHLRRSLLPSLLGARKLNESLANEIIELFETAKIYLPQSGGGLPREEWVLGLTSGRSFAQIKGVFEAILAELGAISVSARPVEDPFLQSGKACCLLLDGRPWGYLGEVSDAAKVKFELRGSAVVGEVLLEPLTRWLEKPPQYQAISPYPSVRRDVNIVVDEAITWQQLSDTVKASAGELLESLTFAEVFRSKEKLGPGKKSLLFSADFRSPTATLTSSEVDALRDGIVAACATRLGAQLRS